MVTPDQISTFFNIYRHKSVVLTQFHLISSSTKLHWPSTTKYQPVPPHTDPVPPNTNQHRLLLTKYYQLLCLNQFCFILTQYYHISSRTVLYWPSTTKYQPVSKHSNVRLSFVDLRWAHLYVSLVVDTPHPRRVVKGRFKRTFVLIHNPQCPPIILARHNRSETFERSCLSSLNLRLPLPVGLCRWIIT